MSAWIKTIVKSKIKKMHKRVIASRNFLEIPDFTEIAEQQFQRDTDIIALKYRSQLSKYS